MRPTIKPLLGLEVRNLYGLNVFRFTRDAQAKKKAVGLMLVWGLLAIVLCLYVGGLSYSLICLGMERAVPAYLMTISSLLIFFFGILRTGSVIFRKEGYDMLCALPVPKWAVVASRLFRVYAEDLALTVAVLLPGMAVYAWVMHPGASVYGLLFLGVWFMPLIPMTGGILMGTLIAGIASRMRHKGLVTAGLSVLTVLVGMYAVSQLAALEEGMDPAQWTSLLEGILPILERLYPPSVGLGRAILEGDGGQMLLWIGISAGVLAVAAVGVIGGFQSICRHLWSSPAKHRYEMGRLSETSRQASLCKREFKRYFSSGIYVANTIISPVLGCVLSGALLVTGMERIRGFIPIPLAIEKFVPFVLAGIFSMLPTTAVSISMEGKEWWILKSLPISTKNILDAKLQMNLWLLLPFYLISELLLFFALRPEGWGILWLIAVPAVFILFSCVWGLTANLRFPVFKWDSEVSVVKQSASALVGGLGGLLPVLGCAIGVGMAPAAYTDGITGGICLAMLLLTVILYGRNQRRDIGKEL